MHLIRCDAHNCLAAIQRDLGDPSNAICHHRRALDIATSINYRAAKARALHGLGLARNALGDQPGALAHWRQALTLYDDMGTPEAQELRGLLARALSARTG